MSSKQDTPKSQKSSASINIKELQQEDTQDHKIPIQQLCQKLNTDAQNGMTNEAAAETLILNGPNALSPYKVEPEYVRLLKCMFEGFASMMWICAFLCFFVHGLEIYFNLPPENIEWFGVVIIIICVFSGFFAYFQESKNINIMNLFNKMAPSLAMVIRDGQRCQILAEEIVVGDLVEIKMGDRIPADIRITECTNLRVENSSITGEAEPTARSVNPTDDNPLETKNMVFYSSYVVVGSGRGIAIATGDNTMIGKLAGLTANLVEEDTPIAKEIQHFVYLIVIMALFSGLIFFFLSLIIEGSIVKAFVYLLGIIIANIPEVLLATVTTALTLTARKMADKNCLVKNLEAVETLGSTSTICSDKTGTLTQNKMTVSHLWYGYQTYSFPDSSEMSKNRDSLLMKSDFSRFLKAATLCLTAEFKYDDEYNSINEREILGDASETGILRFCEHFHSTKSFRTEYPKVAECSFSSLHKFQLSIHKNENNFFVVVKGAPEVILDFCSKIMQEDGNFKEMTPKDLEDSRKACLDLGYLGERVLAYCDFELPVSPYNQDYEFDTSSPENFNFPIKDYIFIGFVSLVDPPRASVLDAVHTCRRAGIKVIMVTGDHPGTAIAIAKTVGIIRENSVTKYERSLLLSHHSSDTEDDAIVVAGSELKDLSQDELDFIIRDYEEIVFARTSPQQKLQIVESCQRIGEIVAVTGDGVNDSPALRKADIGVAMGIAGSDVAKNAADMILLDDNFASIVTGIEEGRLIFDNIKKSIAYTLTSSIPELITMLASLIFSIPLPFTMELVLCIDIGTDLLPAIALAYEKAESDIMQRPPRNPQYDKLVNKRTISMAYGQVGMAQCMAGCYTYFCILMFYGFLPKDLVGLRVPWEDRSVSELKDSYGQSWNYKSRMGLLNMARTGYFVSLVIMQMIVVTMCKTRKNSIFQQGMNNWSLNASILIEVILLCFLLYVPGVEIVFSTMPLSIFWFLPCLPLGICLWVYDEVRRWCIRRFPGGFMEEQTYY